MDYKPIKKEFVSGGSGYYNNPRRFQQLKRVDDVALYQRTIEKNGHPDGFEVIIIHRHNGYYLGEKYIEPAETYPGTCQFGHRGWYFNHLDKAEKFFDKIVKKQQYNKAHPELCKGRGRKKKKQ